MASSIDPLVTNAILKKRRFCVLGFVLPVHFSLTKSKFHSLISLSQFTNIFVCAVRVNVSFDALCVIRKFIAMPKF